MIRKAKKQLPDYIRERLSLDELLASRRVLQLVHEQGPLTQGQASEALALSQGACNLHFQRLEYDGLLRALRLPPEARGPGRPSYPRVFVQLEDFAGTPLLSLSANLRTYRHSESIGERVCALVERAVAEARSRRLTLRNAFAALPGVLDPASGVVRRAVNFPPMEGLDISALMQAKFNLPTLANSLGTAYFYGEAVDIPANKTAMVIYWDLGLGFAFGRNRQLLTVHGGDDGPRMISELGHISIDAQGPRCHCGERGCIEAYAGGWVLLQQFAERGVANLEDLVALARAGDSALHSTLLTIAHLLGRHLAGAIQLTGVNQLNITGPLAPLFNQGRQAFFQGLGEIIGDHRAANIRVLVTEDSEARLQAGANCAARRAYLYPDEFNGLSGLSITLQGQHLASN